MHDAGAAFEFFRSTVEGHGVDEGLDDLRPPGPRGGGGDRLGALSIRTLPGNADALGATLDQTTGIVNFAVRAADEPRIESLELALFENAQSAHPFATVPLQRIALETYAVALQGPGIGAGTLYALSIRRSGEHEPTIITDPHAKALTPSAWLIPASAGALDGAPSSYFRPGRCVVVPPLSRVPEEQILLHETATLRIAEAHLSFTKGHPQVPAHLQGTWAGLASDGMIDYLAANKVNALWVMPSQHKVDELELVLKGRTNVWAYNPASLFAIEPSTCVSTDPIGQIHEVRSALEKLRSRGIEVMLDFVAGHTAEGVGGPSIGFRALAERNYYHLTGDGSYINVTGCGNTLNASHPWTQQLVAEAVDFHLNTLGFSRLRVDQASILGREGTDLHFSAEHPLLQKLQYEKRLIAEPSDYYGCTLGKFPNNWLELHLRWRYALTCFFSDERARDRDGTKVQQLSELVSGNSNLYYHSAPEGERKINRSISVIDCHDYGTLFDFTKDMAKELRKRGLVIASDDDTDLRVKLSRALFASTLFAPGPYSFRLGSERLVTQNGHHNPYDSSEVFKVDWSPNEAWRNDFQRFFAKCNELRIDLRVFDRVDLFTPNNYIFWYDADGRRMTEKAWHDTGAGYLGALYSLERHDRGAETSTVFVARSSRPHSFTLPSLAHGYCWRQVVDTTATDPLQERQVQGDERLTLTLPGVAVFELARAAAAEQRKNRSLEAAA